MDPLRRDMARLVVANIGYKVADALLAVSLARLLPADALGRLLWSLSLARALTPLAGLQAEPLVARRIARQPDLADEQCGGLLAMRAFTTPPFLAAVLLGAWWRPDLWPAIGLIALAIATEDIWHAIGATFIARGRTDLNIRVGVVAQVLLLAGSLGAAALSGSWVVVAAAMVLRSSIALLYAWQLAGRPPARYPAGLLQGVLPFTLGGFVATLTEQADSVLVGLWTPWEDTAAWSLAVRVGWATMFLPQAVAMVLFPAIAARRQPFAVEAVLLGVLGAGVASLMVVVSPWVTPLMFGSLATATDRLIAALAPSLPFMYAVQVLRPGLQARGWERATLAAQIATTLIGLAAAAVLLPRHGVIAAGEARTLAAATQALLLFAVLGMESSRGARGPWVGKTH